MVAEPCSFSFRAGGAENLFGIWCSFRGKDHLISPKALAASTSNYTAPAEFFLDSPLMMNYTYCDGDYEWYILVPGDHYPAIAKWDEDYCDMVGREMFALYNHAVTDGRKSAYESRQEIIKAMSILLEEVPRFGFTNTVPSKGNPILVAPGVRFIERNHSDPASAYYMEAIEGARVKPCTLFKENGLQFTWRARDTETDRIVDYGVIDIALHYGPMLFQNFEDSEKFWNEGYVRIVKA